MSQDQFHQRGQSLEDAFFYKADQVLLDQMRQELEAKEIKEQLSAVSGIRNAALLDVLVEHQIRAETLACVTLIPLVVVAWADGKLQEPERLAILRAMQEKGLGSNDAAVELVNSWLQEAPGENLFGAWKEYIAGLIPNMSTSSREELRDEVIGKAREIAHAAGGYMGVMNSTSRSEKLALEQLEAAFQV